MDLTLLAPRSPGPWPLPHDTHWTLPPPPLALKAWPLALEACPPALEAWPPALDAQPLLLQGGPHYPCYYRVVHTIPATTG